MAMSESGVQKLNPSFQQIRHNLDQASVSFDYNEHSDTLYIYVVPGDQPLASVPQDDGVTSLLVDPETEEVHGFQVDDYLRIAVTQQPNLLEVAHLANINVSMIEEARSRIGEERQREAAIASALASLIRNVDSH